MGDEKPSIQLFIKSSTIDRDRKGSCPMCQLWFMGACILTEHDILSFTVTIVDADSPPKQFLDLTRSKIYPVVIGVSGRNGKGQDITNQLADSMDEVEQFFADFQCVDLKRDGAVLKPFEDLYKTFNAFIQNERDTTGDRLTHQLERLDEYIAENDCRYLIRDVLTYADCYLMPKLHHLRIAAKEFKDYDIPEHLHNVWRYLYEAYQTPAFIETCPHDQDIVKHYEIKAHGRALRGKPSLQEPTHTFSVPAQVARGRSSGSVGDGPSENGEGNSSFSTD